MKKTLTRKHTYPGEVSDKTLAEHKNTISLKNKPKLAVCNSSNT